MKCALLLLVPLAALMTGCPESSSPPGPATGPATGTVAAPALPPALTGHVVDVADLPIEDAIVHAYLSVGGGRKGWEEGLLTKTDAEGAFRLDLTRGLGLKMDVPVYLVVSKPGYVPGNHRLPLYRPEIGLSVEVKLEPGGAFTGLVVGPDGEPFPSALVYAIPPGTGGVIRADMVQSTETGPDGRFHLPGLPLAELDVGVAAKGMLPDISGPYRVQEKSTVEVNEIALEAGASISGTVLTPGGEPIPGAIVRAWRKVEIKEFVLFGRPEIEHAGGLASVGQDGRFSIAELSPGKYDMVVDAVGYRTVVGAMQQVETGRDDLAFILALQKRVELQVLDAGTGLTVDAFAVAITPLDNPSRAVIREEVSGGGGVYRFPASPGVNYQVEVSAEGYEVYGRLIEVTNEGPETIPIPLVRR